MDEEKVKQALRDAVKDSLTSQNGVVRSLLKEVLKEWLTEHARVTEKSILHVLAAIAVACAGYLLLWPKK